MPTYFDCLPGDVLQHVLNDFLNPHDRVILNQAVIQSFPGERVYKKFPADYARKHHILVFKRLFNSLAESINKILDAEFYDIKNECCKKLLKLYKKLFKLMKSPINHCVYKYDKHGRNSIMNSLNSCLEMADPVNGVEIYIDLERYLEENGGNPIRGWIQEVFEIIATTPFERQLLTKSHITIY